jgi:hypothetical protein
MAIPEPCHKYEPPEKVITNQRWQHLKVIKKILKMTIRK